MSGNAVVARMARRSAGRRFGRIAATLLGVTLATSFCVAAFGVAAQLDELVGAGQDAVDAIGVPAGSVVVTSRASGATETTAISNQLIDRIEEVDGVLTAQGTFDQPIGVRLAGGVQRERPPILRGLVFTSSWDPTRWTLTEGSAPDFWSPDRRGVIAVALDATGLRAANASIGDEIRLQTPTGGWRGLVVGVVSATTSAGRFEDANAIGDARDLTTAAAFALADAHIVMPADILPTLLGAQGRVDRITVTPRPGVTPENLAARLAPALPSGLRIVAATDRDALQAAAVATISNGVTAATWAFAILAAIVAAIIVSNTFSIIVSQRTAEIALARCIGFTKGQSFAVFVGEASLVGVVAAGLGLALGVPLAVLGASTLRPGTEIRPMLTLAMVAAALLVGLGVTILSAFRPALKAARVSPLEALRTSTTRRHRRGLILTCISPLLSLIRRVGERSATARMALDNARRDPKRASATVATLFIGIGLTAAVLTASASVRQAIDDQYRDASSSQLFIQRRGVVRIDAASLRDRLGVPRSAGGYVDTTAVDGVLRGPAGTVAGATTVDPAATLEQFRLDPVGVLPTTVAGGAFLSDDAAGALGVQLGGLVTLRSTSGGEIRLPVLGEYRRTKFFGPAMIDRTMAAGVQADGTFEAAAIAYDEGPPVSAAKNYLSGRLRGFNSVSVDTPAAFATRDTDIATVVTRLILVLLVGAVLLGGLGTANSVSLSVLERRRELAMLRAIGAGRNEIRRLISLENLALCGAGGAFAVAVGTFLGVVGVWLAPPKFTGQVIVPWPWLVALVVATTAIGAVSAAIPAHRAGRRDILADLDAL